MTPSGISPLIAPSPMSLSAGRQTPANGTAMGMGSSPMTGMNLNASASSSSSHGFIGNNQLLASQGAGSQDINMLSGSFGLASGPIPSNKRSDAKNKSNQQVLAGL